ncbi:bifunctional folylpolyglutamate synthase/dihydrofolate synthase [Altericroceibacterium spongiae]|uniref:Bifunctional folylpolyglutamate synthase/dihydrofolate synthase n=1 Tax=Altericroceibacterium spongiae TaxID=2320269 RepID=A0A420EEY0_9SPHN|nr:folylpolyglutamate synthase/dihydrofolate synthase family protein [Altericroceibacterium spongiae]RKF19230.1 bifunctional folylpolyglutamate synthase/dihydrofolate synthase [Altericroceibacterium spongiae]
MKDFASSDNPAVQAQLDRLAALTLPQGRLGLEVIHELLARLGDPQKRLPPAFHVAGTNGKGSTCTFLRMMMEAEGLSVHSATKPHLVRYNERIRLAGELIDDALLAELLREVLDTGEDLHPSFFEVTTAAIFLAFARIPADVCVIEVGLGGRFDATNVLEHPAACGIATLGIDHEAFLLRPEEGTPDHPLARIAFEKAGIARPGCPLVTQSYPEEARLEVERIAGLAGAPLHMRGESWWAEIGETIEYRDRFGVLTLPLPPLMPGVHQSENAALAVAMLRHQDRINVSPASMAQGIRMARWPARLQKLSNGPLTRHAGAREVWLDGGHNPDAGLAIARHIADRPLHLVIGMLANKDPSALIAPLAGSLLSITVVPVPGSECHTVEAFGPSAKAAPDVAGALDALPDDGQQVLIAGSLYLAGKVLLANEELPD